MQRCRLLTLLALLCGVATTARGELLPVRGYTTSDGLVSNFVQRIVGDSRGFLWFCARGGLSRFDGHTFKNYTTADGLPNPTVNDFYESRSGEYWIATNGGGVVRFLPDRPLRDAEGNPNFKILAVGDTAQTNRINRLYEDRLGRIWATTDGGVFCLEESDGASQFRFIPFEPQAAPSEKYGCTSLAEDGAGAVWVETRDFGIVRLLADGRLEVYRLEELGLYQGVGTVIITALAGRLWVAGLDKLSLLVAEPKPNAPLIERSYRVLQASPYNYVVAICRAADGHFLIGSLDGLSEFDGETVRFFEPASFADKHPLGGIVEDINGNIWIASGSNGALKLTRKGFTHFAETYGTASLYGIVSFSETASGEVLAASGSGELFRRQDSRFVVVNPVFPRGLVFTWLTNAVFQDHTGQVWMLATNRGLLRFAAAAASRTLAAKPVAVYGGRDGLASPFRIYEDRRGDLWISTVGAARDRLWRWERQSETFHRLTTADGLPPHNSAFTFAEDAAGNLWIGFYDGGVGRFYNGRFELFSPAEQFPARMVTALYFDQQGRLWLGANSQGVMRVDNPTAEKPVVAARYTTATGLASDDIRSLVEDNFGRIYVGSSRGIDRLEPISGEVAHFGLNDGLPNDFVLSAFRDRRGNLWFGTFKGVVRLTPQAVLQSNQPEVFISGLRVGGIRRPVAEIGERELRDLEFAPAENNIQIDFGAVSLAFGESLRFRYKLDGVGTQWSAPTAQRSVNLSLAPGAYRFLVQAVSTSGEPLSDRSAALSFRILAPVWQRGWFLTAAAAALLAVAYALYRYRVAHLLAVERVRTRIASDLHDDIGASLSQIAIVSEVLQRQVNSDDARIGANLSLMARISREAVDSMSDIVWAINPHKDNLQDLLRRLRRFASESLPNRDIELEFVTPESVPNLKLGADFRRQVFLIFKESVNNVLKHSSANRAQIVLRLEGNALLLRVADNGRGFAVGDTQEGNGLRNMRQRAAQLGGSCDILSADDAGTTVSLRLPFHQKPT